MSDFFRDQYLKQFNKFIVDLKNIFNIEDNINDNNIDINNKITNDITNNDINDDINDDVNDDVNDDINEDINDDLNDDENHDINNINIKHELKSLEELDDTEKILRGTNFNNFIKDDLFNLFLKSKIKVFSHKNEDTQNISEALFGKKLSLKILLNYQPKKVKHIIWDNLYLIYITSEFIKPTELQNYNNILLLNNKLFKKNIDINNDDKKTIKNKLEEILDINVNNKTSEMIDDIVNSFENTLKNSTNPLMNVMDISKQISEKYTDQINNGDIELDKILNSIVNKIPGMDNLVSNLIPKTNTDILNKNISNENVIMNESFSTSNVEIGQLDNNDNNMNIKIGNMLKMVDNLGLLSNNKNNDSINVNNLLGSLLNNKSNESSNINN